MRHLHTFHHAVVDNDLSQGHTESESYSSDDDGPKSGVSTPSPVIMPLLAADEAVSKEQLMDFTIDTPADCHALDSPDF